MVTKNAIHADFDKCCTEKIIEGICVRLYCIDAEGIRMNLKSKCLCILGNIVNF